VNAVRAWFLNDAVPPSSCPRGKPLVSTLGPLPAASQPARLSPLATYAIAAKTLREAQAASVLAKDSPVAGIYGGRLVPSSRGFTLVRYSIAPGVELSGAITLTKTQLPLVFEGTVKVGGIAAAAGLLGLTEKSLRGTLGGRLVG
jgi:hypothetical protein